MENLAREIAKAIFPQNSRISLLRRDDAIPIIAAKLAEVRGKIENCVGFALHECLTCDEAGACVIEIWSALGGGDEN